MQSLDHAHLGVGRATSDNKGKNRESVNLLIREGIELLRSHDHGIGGVLFQGVHVGRNDVDISGDGSGGCGMISSQHVDGDTGLVAESNGRGRLGTRRVVKTDQAAEGQVLLNLVAVNVLTLADSTSEGSAGQGEHAKSTGGDGFHVGDDVFPVGISDGLWLSAVLGDDGSARTNDSLDSTLGEDKVLAGRDILVDDGHFLDVRVEGELGLLDPHGLVTRGEAQTVVVEASGEDLDGDFSRITLSLPLLFGVLLYSSDVGHGGNLEVLFEVAREVAPVEFGGVILFLVLGIDLVRLLRVMEDPARRGIVGAAGLLREESSLRGDPGLAGNHLALGEGTSLVGADVFTLVSTCSEGEHRTYLPVTEPRASRELRLRTMTFLSTMRFVPTVMVMVKTTTSEDGIMETPVATA